MTLIGTYLIALAVLTIGFIVTDRLDEKNHERIAQPIRIGLTAVTALLGIFVIFMFPYDLFVAYYTSIIGGVLAIILTTIFCTMSFTCCGIHKDNKVWCLFLLSAVSIFIAISCFVGYHHASQAYKAAYAAAPVSYVIEETIDIHASASADRFELDGGGLLAFHVHGESSNVIRVWQSVSHPTYPDRTSYQQRDFTVDGDFIISYISSDESPRVEIGSFTRDMPDPWPDEIDRTVTTVFIPEGTIQDIGISVS